jgi:hypothetical protein
MPNRDSSHDYSTICNIIPGFAFYDDLGSRIASAIVVFIEYVIDLIGRFRT